MCADSRRRLRGFEGASQELTLRRLALFAALGASLLVPLSSRAAAANSRAAQIAAHDWAVHIHDQWIRDPYIVRAEDGWFYLTGTTLQNEPDKVIGIPAWRSRDLATWEQLPRLWTFADSAWMQRVKPQPRKSAAPVGADFVPLDVSVVDGDVVVHAKDPRYAKPGSEEAQTF